MQVHNTSVREPRLPAPHKAVGRVYVVYMAAIPPLFAHWEGSGYLLNKVPVFPVSPSREGLSVKSLDARGKPKFFPFGLSHSNRLIADFISTVDVINREQRVEITVDIRRTAHLSIGIAKKVINSFRPLIYLATQHCNQPCHFSFSSGFPKRPDAQVLQ